MSETTYIADRSPKGHPGGLYLLFGVEAWERFSYYGMRALLMLYMVKYLAFDTQRAGTIYGWYTGLVYFTPMIGGYIADRYLGARACILLGGLLMAAGHFAMAIPDLPFFFSALALLIVGNGFFKPNISTVVGKLYSPTDPRRDGAFTIFYMGINLGAFFSPLICGTLGETVGWHYGFGAAGVGMIAGLVMYMIWGNRYLGNEGRQPMFKPQEGVKQEPLTVEEKHRIAVIFILSFFVIFFWAAFEQAGSSLTLFADRETDRMIPWINWEFPTSWFQAVNPLLIVLLAPMFSSLWINMALRKKEPSTPIKMVVGLLLLTVGFVIMIFAAMLHGQNGTGETTWTLDPSTGEWGPVAQYTGTASILWLLGAYLFHTLGELCLSPVGLSMVTKLAPIRFASLLMGTWFLSSFLANFVGGVFAGNYDEMNHTLFFTIPTATAAGAALILLLLAKPLSRWMHGVH